MRESKSSKKFVVIAMMAAIGMVLQFVAIPFPFFTFLKIDFSDVFVLLPMFIYGPLAGITTAIIRSILHLLLTGFDLPNMVGDFSAILASLSYTLPIYFVFADKSKKLVTPTRKKAVSAYLLGTGVMTFVMAVANYFVITPLYLYLFHVDAKSFLGVKLSSYITFGIVPFNLLKGVVVSVVFALLYPKLKKFLQSKM